MREMEPLVEEAGILASDDPVAIDQASFDLAIKHNPEFKRFAADRQLAHGEELGMGGRSYELRSV